MNNLIKEIKVKIFDETQIKIGSLDVDLNNLRIEENDKKLTINCMLDLVTNCHSSNSNELLDFIKMPPTAMLSVGKPIFIDLVWNYVDYGEECAIIKKDKNNEKKGFFKSLFG